MMKVSNYNISKKRNELLGHLLGLSIALKDHIGENYREEDAEYDLRDCLSEYNTGYDVDDRIVRFAIYIYLQNLNATKWMFSEGF